MSVVYFELNFCVPSSFSCNTYSDDTGLVSQGLIEENGVKYRFNRLIVCIDNGCND